MTPAASTEEIRTAYRALARRLHPDRAGGATPAERALADRRMREINESWEVLRDPDRRRAYDLDRLAGGRRPSSAGGAPPRPRAAPPARVEDPDDDLVDVLPPMTALTAGLLRHLPWVVALVVFGLIFVVSAYAGSDDGTEAPAPSSAAANVGRCIDVEAGPSTTVVPCDGPHELEIVTRSVQPEDCPAGTEARRLATDGRFDCVRAG